MTSRARMKKIQQKNKMNKEMKADATLIPIQPPPAAEQKPKRKCKKGEKSRKSKNTEEDQVNPTMEEPKPETGKCKEAEKSRNSEEEEKELPQPMTGKCQEAKNTEEDEVNPTTEEPKLQTGKCKEAEDCNPVNVLDDVDWVSEVKSEDPWAYVRTFH